MSEQASASDPFIILDVRQKADDKEIRKKIRSRAAQHSHRVGPRKYKPTKRGRVVNPDNEGEAAAGIPGELVTPTSSVPPLTAETSQSTDSTAGEEPETQLLEGSTIPSDTLARHQHKYDGVPIHMTNGVVYPVPEQPFFSWVVPIMWDWMLASWEMIDVTNKERSEALTWVQRLTLSDPTYFYMNMLSLCGPLVDAGRLDVNVAPWLMARTVAAINEALSDPHRRLGAGVILSVGRIALREIMRGDRGVGASVHRPAQAKMLAMIGGLDAFAVPRLVQEHVYWAERMMTHRTGVSMSQFEPSAMRISAVGKFSGRDEDMLHSYYDVSRRFAGS